MPKEKPEYDLEERLLDYAARIIKLIEFLPRTRPGLLIADQLMRSGTSPLSNHGEAQAAESRKDFVHKLSIALKELKESRRWLKLIPKVGLIKETHLLQPIMMETEELICIFNVSIRTAKSKLP